MYSLFDKGANAGILFWVVGSYSEDAHALRWIMAILPIGCALGAYGLSYFGHKFFSHKLAKITGINVQQ